MNNSGNDVTTLFSTPITITLYTLLLFAILYTAFGRLNARRKADF
mgnify:FL=1